MYQGVTIGGSHGRHREDGRGFWQPQFREQRYRTRTPCIFGPIYVGGGAIVKAARIVTKDVGPGTRYKRRLLCAACKHNYSSL